MQFSGYHINNLKSYRKYFCLADAVDALENGAYLEWLDAIWETMKEREDTFSEDGLIIEEIRLMLRPWLKSEKMVCQSAGADAGKTHDVGTQEMGPHDITTNDEKMCGKKLESDESYYQKLFLLFYRLAHLTMTDEDMMEMNRLACLKAEGQKRRLAYKEEGKDVGREIFLTGKEYRLPVWRKERVHQPLIWKKLINKGSFPVSVRTIKEVRVKAHTKGYACEEELRCLNPGGYAWMLTQNGCFVRWGRRVQVHKRSFACVDRNGCLTVDGDPMRGDGMVDFSFDRRTGILGVDKDGGLRQYSGLELDEEIGNEGKIVFASLKGKVYCLVKENGTVVTNLREDAGLRPEEVFLDEREFRQESAAKDLPFPAAVVSVSKELIGFETSDSCVGVWDREREQIIWMEGTVCNGTKCSESK